MTVRKSDLLGGLVVVDAGQGMCTTLIAKFLGDFGATVIRPAMPEGDPFLDVYPAMRAWRAGYSAPNAGQGYGWEDMAAHADVLILGGEDYPGLARTGGAAALSARHPQLIALEVTALPIGMPGRPCVSNELLVQARSGLVWEHFSDRPIPITSNPANYGAAVQGLSAILAALVHRERKGSGQAVWTSLLDGTFMLAASLWLETERPTPSANLVAPKDLRPLILKCADGDYVHVFVGSPALARGLYDTLGLEMPAHGVKLWASEDPKDFFGYTEKIAAAARAWKRADLIKALTSANITVGPVLAPGECWSDPQIIDQQFIKTAAEGERYLGPIIKATRSRRGSKLAEPATDAPALDGVTIVDFGTFVAGPYASVVLGDLGADVIKVEPKGGDLGRGMYRVYSVCNRSKRTIRIALADPAGSEIMQRLCMRADVVMSNFRTGVTARRGIDARTLHAKRPELVVLEAPAYGDSGPLAKHAGYDPIMQAWTGHEVRQGGAGNAPVWTRFTGADYIAGAVSGVSVLAGLYHRATKGTGHEIISSLVGGALFMMSELIQEADGAFNGAPPLDARQQGLHPAEALYQTKNGWVAVVAPDDTSARALASALGLEALTRQPRSSWSGAAQAELGEALAKLEMVEAVAMLGAAGVWVEPCEQGQPARWMSDTFLQSQGMIREFHHAQMGKTREVGILFRMEKSKTDISRLAPETGQHSREILLELGYSVAEVEQLFASGVVM